MPISDPTRQALPRRARVVMEMPGGWSDLASPAPPSSSPLPNLPVPMATNSPNICPHLEPAEGGAGTTPAEPLRQSHCAPKCGTITATPPAQSSPRLSGDWGHVCGAAGPSLPTLGPALTLALQTLLPDAPATGSDLSPSSLRPCRPALLPQDFGAQSPPLSDSASKPLFP